MTVGRARSPSPSRCRRSGGTAAGCAAFAGRRPGGPRAPQLRRLPGRRGSAMGALFAYVATSAFVLQSMNGLSPDRLLGRLRRQRRRHDPRRARRGPARRAGRHPQGHPRRPGRRPGRRRRDAGRRRCGSSTPLLVAVVCFFVLMTAQGLIGPERRRARLRRGPRAPRHRLRRPRLRPMGRRRPRRPDRRPRRRAHRRPDGRPSDRRRRRLHGRAARPRTPAGGRRRRPGVISRRGDC